LTGWEALRQNNPHVVNLRCDYLQEAERLVDWLVEHRKLSKIVNVVFTDAKGRSGAKGVEDALKRRGKSLFNQATCDRNTIALADALNMVSTDIPEAVIGLVDCRAFATFIKAVRMHPKLDKVTFCIISFTDVAGLVSELGEEAKNIEIVAAQVVPFFKDESIPVVKEFHEDMKRIGEEKAAGFISLEGYLAAKLFCMAVQRVEGELTQEKFLKVFENNGVFYLGGFELKFKKGDNQGSDQVFLVQIQGDKIETLRE
jgi:branched-chain amino acid transport system substrate-binding protein